MVLDGVGVGPGDEPVDGGIGEGVAEGDEAGDGPGDVAEGAGADDQDALGFVQFPLPYRSIVVPRRFLL